MSELADLLVRHDEEAPLDRAALCVAAIEQPDVKADPFIELLNSHARELAERISPEMDGEEFVLRANEYLFEELGFCGNSEDYYDPRNSCLNEVLLRRTGIPITLSVIYLEIARRLKRPVYGVGLPGHFIVAYDDGEFATYIDPFHGGQLLDEEDCYELAAGATGQDFSNQPAVLAPVNKRDILLRMLNNLRAIYLRRGEYAKAVAVLDWLVAGEPGNAELYKMRGVCLSLLRRYQAAKPDLERYLELAPEAEDRGQIESHLEVLRRWLSMLQ
jgi:regulator of sirC expression with transglutaminase-like and TPR domain